MRVIEFSTDKKNLELVAGLDWHPLQRAGSAQRKEILDIAKDQGENLKILRGGDSPHVGLAKQAEGAKPGQISIAALIADALSADGKRNCLVAVALPENNDQLLFIAIRGGVILADGDFVGTRDEIKVRLIGDVSYGGWDCTIAPAEWDITDGQERDLASFLSPDTLKQLKRWKLRETNIAWRKAAVLAAVLLAVGLGTMYGYQTWQQKRILAAEALRLQQEAVELGQKMTLAEPVKPWPLAPLAVNFVAACTQAFRQTNGIAGNWQLDSVVCENNVLQYKWIKSTAIAWSSHLAMTRSDISIALDGMSASLSVPANADAANDFTTQLPQTSIQIHYQDIAARLGVALHIEAKKQIAAMPTLPGQTAGTNQTDAASWQELIIKIESALDPIEVVQALSQPGLRFTRLEFNTKAGIQQYKLIGVQYVRN